MVSYNLGEGVQVFGGGSWGCTNTPKIKSEGTMTAKTILITPLWNKIKSRIAICVLYSY